MIWRRSGDKRARNHGAGLLGASIVERVLVIVIATFIVGRTVFLLTQALGFRSDDAYITFRYARHLVEGHGIVWNIGEGPVEGYSNFLFLLLAAGALQLGLDPGLVVRIVSCLALAVTCVLLFVLSRRWIGPVGATLPTAVFTFYVGTIAWTVGLLETAVYVMLVILALTCFFAAYGPLTENEDHHSGKWRSSWLAMTGLVVFLLGITRFEGPLVGIALAAALGFDYFRRALIARRGAGRAASREVVVEGTRMLAVLGLSFAVPYAIYFAWRYNYFGRLLPNPFYCKIDYDGDPWHVFRQLWDVGWPAFIFATGSVVALFRRPDPRVLSMVILVALYVAVFHGVHPVVSFLNRHSLAAFAILLILGAIGLFKLIEKVPISAPRYLREFAIVFWILLGTSVFIPRAGRQLYHLGLQWEKQRQNRIDVSTVLQGKLQPEDTFVIGDAGIVPYLTSAKVIDAYCLNSAEMTGPSVDMSSERFAQYILQQRPEIIVVHNRMHVLQPDTLLYVYPALVAEEGFLRDYTLVDKVAIDWIFERNDRIGQMAGN